MDEPLPVGLGLRVPPPAPAPSSSASTNVPQSMLYFVNNAIPPAVPTPTVPTTINISEDGLCEFDELDLNQVRMLIFLAEDYLELSFR
jgi:ubiquitin-conjugating enzyme E2 Q